MCSCTWHCWLKRCSTTQQAAGQRAAHQQNLLLPNTLLSYSKLHTLIDNTTCGSTTPMCYSLTHCLSTHCSTMWHAARQRNTLLDKTLQYDTLLHTITWYTIICCSCMSSQLWSDVSGQRVAQQHDLQLDNIMRTLSAVCVCLQLTQKMSRLTVQSRQLKCLPHTDLHTRTHTQVYNNSNKLVLLWFPLCRLQWVGVRWTGLYCVPMCELHKSRTLQLSVSFPVV